MAILKPEQMDFSTDNIIMIISGLPGVGKTTLACSAPDVAVIDVDNGMKRVRPHHRRDALLVNTYEELLSDLKSPDISGKKTLVFDTTGAFIDLLKDWAMRNNTSACKKGGGISQQGYGIVKSEFLRLSAELRRKHNVVYIFHTSKKADKDGNPIYELMCEGAAREVVWQPADLGAYLQIIDNERYLCFSPTQEYSAKASYGIKGMHKVPELAEGEPNTFLTQLFEQVKVNQREESEAFKPQKDAYDAAILDGDKIIASISEPEDVAKAMDKLNKLSHSLTSEKELRSKFAERLSDLGITYNKETKAYERK